MPKNSKKHKVYIIESEAGWGQKIDAMKEFKTERAAKAFVTRYNNKWNKEKTTPDWYMVAVLAKNYMRC